MIDAKSAITTTVLHEVYIDLWGMSNAWMEAFYKKIDDECYETGRGDDLELYRCEACMAMRFRSTDHESVLKAQKIATQLYPLAMKKLIKEDKSPSDYYYHQM